MANLSVATDLPQYIKNEDQNIYFELLSLILSQWFNSNGFYQPTLSSDEVSALLALPNPPPIGAHWLNSDKNAMQFIDINGNVQTITSS